MKTNKTLNLHLFLVLIALFLLLVYLLGCGIGKLQIHLEGPETFANLNPSISSNPPTSSSLEPSSSNNDNSDNSYISDFSPGPSELTDNSFMYEIENKDLTISDFYPTEKVYSGKSTKEILDFTMELDLFHQIIPKLKKGYLGIVGFDSRIAGIYQTDDLSSKKWTKLEKDMPPDMESPVFISYDKDRMLLGIFEDIEGRHTLFKKDCTGLESEWLPVEKSPVVSFIYDEDERLIGLDSKGNYYKKSNTILESEWEPLTVNFDHIPMRKLLFDYQSGVMLGVGHDFRIYKKRYNNWLESEWGEGTPKSLSSSIRDLFYDYDGHLVGLSRVGIVKKKDAYYLTEFELYEKSEKKEVSVYKLLYAITGIKHMAQYGANNNSNNVYVDGKKISEYKFKDPRLNKFLDYRMKVKKECRKLKAMKIIDDNKKQGEQEQIRNQKFSRILNEQKNTIDTLMDTIQGLKDSSF